jgi:hypothetical protein
VEQPAAEEGDDQEDGHDGGLVTGGWLNIIGFLVAARLVVAVAHKIGIGDDQAVVAPPAGREDELAASGSGARQ